MSFIVFGEEYKAKVSFPIKGKFKKGDWAPVDLSSSNKELSKDIYLSLDSFDEFIQDQKKFKNVLGLYGGYSEKRNVYQKSQVFSEGSKQRSIHLGIDFWIAAGSIVQAPIPGIIHSFKNNNQAGDYGPTLIMKHYFGNSVFYSLYGHLSQDSLKDKKIGDQVDRKQEIGRVGEPHENVDWPPHLHFQIIKNIGDYSGDYPGVSTKKESEYYLSNCPDPLSIFGYSWKKKLS